MIAGQSPRIKWRANPPGEVRTLDQAIEIAIKNGVVIPDDVSFWLDESGELSAEWTACGPRIEKEQGSLLGWKDLVHDQTQKVPFRIWGGILVSDEAIVAVLAHEMFELERLRSLLLRAPVSIGQLINMTCPGNPGNLHDQAWELADQKVMEMRKRTRK
jgi:hypothetical protein